MAAAEADTPITAEMKKKLARADKLHGQGYTDDYTWLMEKAGIMRDAGMPAAAARMESQAEAALARTTPRADLFGVGAGVQRGGGGLEHQLAMVPPAKATAPPAQQPTPPMAPGVPHGGGERRFPLPRVHTSAGGATGGAQRSGAAAPPTSGARPTFGAYGWAAESHMQEQPAWVGERGKVLAAAGSRDPEPAPHGGGMMWSALTHAATIKTEPGDAAYKPGGGALGVLARGRWGYAVGGGAGATPMTAAALEEQPALRQRSPQPAQQPRREEEMEHGAQQHEQQQDHHQRRRQQQQSQKRSANSLDDGTAGAPQPEQSAAQQEEEMEPGAAEPGAAEPRPRPSKKHAPTAMELQAAGHAQESRARPHRSCAGGSLTSHLSPPFVLLGRRAPGPRCREG